ncbi:hypothetical protein LSTR_LSTR008045 [Laodelphax striatellus]|uniref:Uncharacterized protein n=1 Tax=Laodelphax striatellus TaxID=195883 RepID=A0A482XMH2_LAOST|nr:hypothetical protein LSTR_LSTR008045 [Laodelphax striatellus]
MSSALLSQCIVDSFFGFRTKIAKQQQTAASKHFLTQCHTMAAAWIQTMFFPLFIGLELCDKSTGAGRPGDVILPDDLTRKLPFWITYYIRSVNGDIFESLWGVVSELSPLAVVNERCLGGLSWNHEFVNGLNELNSAHCAVVYDCGNDKGHFLDPLKRAGHESSSSFAAAYSLDSGITTPGEIGGVTRNIVSNQQTWAEAAARAKPSLCFPQSKQRRDAKQTSDRISAQIRRLVGGGGGGGGSKAAGHATDTKRVPHDRCRQCGVAHKATHTSSARIKRRLTECRNSCRRQCHLQRILPVPTHYLISNRGILTPSGSPHTDLLRYAHVITYYLL